MSTILQGDVLDQLATLPDESVQCVVTSPPYWGLRDYGVDGQLGLEKVFDCGGKGNQSLSGRIHYLFTGKLKRASCGQCYICKMAEVFREVRRVLRKDGTLWLNMGDSYANSGCGGSSVFENGRNDGRLDDGGKERIKESRKIMKKSIVPAGLKPKDLMGQPWRLALALQSDGWWLRSDIIWNKSNPMPESCKDRPTSAHEHVFLLTKLPKYYYDADAIKTDSKSLTKQTEQALSFEREVNEPNRPGQQYPRHRPQKMPDGWATHEGDHGSFHKDGREKGAWPGIGKQHAEQRDRGESQEPMETHQKVNARNVWNISTQAYPDAHFATFPEKLARLCIMAGSKHGDTVMDIFGGSGTTAKVAQDEGREWIVIELNPEYIPMIEKRTAIKQTLLNLGV